ncbi:phage major tail protein, TP901-1 family [Aerococcaceae bacterium zg-B36]|uniref:phage major tail protein, TP901-1 family n=1 Tax=Aerococcaceae bacterium zg-252 TaxID=2796928 RepID=UPI001BD8D496|nr:phage major tail protein, TP901-1 family [Aerococcaceae bacterium zg-B36]
MAAKELLPVNGKNKYLLFRLLENAKTKAASKLLLQTEHEWSFERDQEAVKTKDGAVIASGGMEVSLSISAVSAYDEVNEMLYKSVVEDKMLEVWEVDITQPASGGKFKGRYARGKLSSWTLPSSVDGLEELDTEMAIEGIPVDGEVTLTAEQKLLIEAAYGFQDTTVMAG